jgi:DNA-binding transcriptional LysR family regulator
MQTNRWDDWRVFLAVARAGSLQRAAVQLGVNHSTAWRRLQTLDKALGTPLFERGPAGYALTSVGEAALPYAQRMEEEMFALHRVIAGTDRVPAGLVRVTAPESMLPMLAPFLIQFQDAHPQIELAMHTGDRFYDLGRQEADVAIRPSPSAPESVEAHEICRIAWTAYTREAPDAPFVSYSAELAHLAAVRWRTQRFPQATGLRVSSVPAMATLLAEGKHRGMLPCFVGDGDMRLQRVQPPIPEASSRLWLLVHTDLRRNARVRVFVDAAGAFLSGCTSLMEGRSPAHPT